MHSVLIKGGVLISGATFHLHDVIYWLYEMTRHNPRVELCTCRDYRC